MTRTRITQVLLVSALLLGACGSPDGDGSRKHDPDEAAQLALEFYQALATGDHEVACALLSEPTRDRMTSREEDLALQESRQSGGCAAGLEHSFVPGPISQVEIADVGETDTAVEVFLTRDAETGLRAQVVLDDGEWRVDEYQTATGPLSLEPLCSGDAPAGEDTELQQPPAGWAVDFQDYYVDLSDDRVVTSTGGYTQVLVDELEACGMSVEVFEDLLDQVALMSPNSRDALPAFTFTSIAGNRLFVCQLVNVAANTYELVSCVTTDTTGS